MGNQEKTRVKQQYYIPLEVKEGTIIIKASESYAIAAIMMKIEGWEKSGKRKNIVLYGRQRIYEKVVPSENGLK